MDDRRRAERRNEQDRPPAFQFYCRDFLASEKVQAMTDKEFRAYVNLLAQAWLSTPVGTLPDDDRILASLSRVGRQGWKAVQQAVRACFDKVGERLANPRLVQQWNALVALSRTRAEAGRQGMAKRWKTTEAQSVDDNKPITKAITKHNSASASASASAIKTTAEVFPDNKTPNDQPPEHTPEVTYCSACQCPYAPGETDDNHNCTRALKKAGVL